MNNPTQQFIEAIQAAGLTPPEIIEAGKFHRFPGEGKRNGNTAGWCRQFADGMGGVYGDHSTGLSGHWQAKRDRPYSASEHEDFRRQCAESRKQDAAELAQRQAEAASKSAGIWSAALPAPDNHSYLVNKGIKAHGAKFDGRCLVIPMLDSGVLHSVQTIEPDGVKRFLTGGRIAGCYYPIGKPDGTLCIGEGFATAVSVLEATGHAVAVAFSAGNMLSVAKVLRAKFPDIRLILCADDDHITPGNPGLSKATEAAQAVGGLVAVPDFGSDRPDGASDFNDLAMHRGQEAVQRDIAKASAPPMPAYQPGQDIATQGVVEGGDALAGDRETIERLAALPALDYDRVRKAEAEKLGVRAETLDREVRAIRGDADADSVTGEAVMFPELDPWPSPVDGAALLNDLASIIQRFVILPPHAANAIALWVVMTYLIDVVQVAPILAATSPEKRCGKSTLLFLLVRLASRALPSSNITAAALFRAVEKWQPTLIVDEADSFISESDELRGVLNSGHTRDTAFVIRTVGDDHEPRQFSTWGAKAIALIGTLPDTLHDRSIVIALRRKLPSEVAEKVRHADPDDFKKLASKCVRFATDNPKAIQSARPAIPDALHDRAGDNWEPLFSIADLAGGKWPEKARAAARELSGAEGDAGDSIRVTLLADICVIFELKGADKLSTVDLVEALTADAERPWVEFRHGKPITARQLAKQLSGFGIVPNTIRDGEKRFKGYQLDQFADARARYLSASDRLHGDNPIGTPFSEYLASVTQPPMSPIVKTPEAAPSNVCHRVTGRKGESGGGAGEERYFDDVSDVLNSAGDEELPAPNEEIF